MASKKHQSFEKMQKFNQYTAHLPNLDLIKTNAYQEFKDIKQNLSKAVVLNELRPGILHWSTRLQTFINEYGICFKKKDQINLIELYLELIFTADIDFVIISICLTVLVELLKKINLLSSDDLKIDWKSVYKLYQRISSVNDRSTELAPANLEQVTFVNFVCYARVYFDINATREMLEEWRPLMCSYDMSMVKAFELYDLFLPTLLQEHQIEHGFKLWLKEFLDLWITSSISRSYWESTLISLLSRAAADNIGLFDWTPYIPYIFSKLLRGFGLSLSQEDSLNITDESVPKETSVILNNLSQKFALTNTDIYHFAKLITSIISNCENDLCMNYIISTFKLLRSYYYPSNSDVSMENFFALLESFPTELIERIRHERSDKYKLIKNKETVAKNSLKENDIQIFVNCLKDITLTAIFSKTHFNDAIKTFQYLCFLRADIMLPPLLEKIGTSFHVLIETHRYTSMLACLVSVPRELVSYNAYTKTQFQTGLIDLMCQILPGIDINDLNKFILTNQLLTNVLNCISICDCSPALSIRDDLTEHEKEVCMQTAKFEDFIQLLLKKIFDFIDHVANEATSDNIESTNDSLLTRNLQEITEENVIQSHLIQMIKTLVNQSSKKLLKLITRKLYSYMSERDFSFKSGAIVGSFSEYLSNSINSTDSFSVLFNSAYDSLKKFKDSRQCA